MAGKADIMPVAVATEGQTAKTQAERDLIEIHGKINKLVDQYNEYQQYAEMAKMALAIKDLKQLAKDYAEAAEVAAIEKLAKQENPMLALARCMVYDVITVREPKASTPMETGVTSRCIDPLRLNKVVKGGIGEKKDWMHAVQRLNYALTVYAMHKVGIDPNRVFVDIPYTMKEEARRLEVFKANCASVSDIKMTSAEEDLLVEDLQMVVNSMISNVTVDSTHLWQLLLSHCKFDNGKTQRLSATRDSAFRINVMRIISQVINGASVEMRYPSK